GVGRKNCLESLRRGASLGALRSSHPPAHSVLTPNYGHTFPSLRHVIPGPSHFPHQPGFPLTLSFIPDDLLPHLAHSLIFLLLLCCSSSPSFTYYTDARTSLAESNCSSSLIARSYTHALPRRLHKGP